MGMRVAAEGAQEGGAVAGGGLDCVALGPLVPAGKEEGRSVPVSLKDMTGFGVGDVPAETAPGCGNHRNQALLDHTVDITESDAAVRWDAGLSPSGSRLSSSPADRRDSIQA